MKALTPLALLAAAGVASASSLPYHARFLQPRADQCLVSQPTIKAPMASVWRELSAGEITDAWTIMRNPDFGLNLTDAAAVNITDPDRMNQVIGMELLAPNKTQTLPFLAGTGPEPDRYVRATLIYRDTPEPYVQEFMVGPLPLGSQSKAVPLTFYGNRGTDGKIPVADADSAAMSRFKDGLLKQIEPVCKLFWNLTLDGISFYQDLPSKEDGRDIVWQGVFSTTTNGFNAQSMLPMGLYTRLDITGRDSSKWSAKWMYNNVMYNSTETFLAAALAPGFEILPGNFDGPWTSTDQTGEPMLMDDLPPPSMVQTGSKRFLVDHEQHYVQWMDFSFYAAHSKDTGLKLYDVKYKGERILYELGMEEALAHYTGNDPTQSHTCYIDSFYGFGKDAVTLVPGYDCPAQSTYMNVSYVDGETRKVTPRGICLFELDKGFPIQRHASASSTSATRNIAFTMRTINTVGNYDYMTSYEFSMDGSIDVSVRASGYIQGAHVANNEEYGFRIHDQLSGSIHDHVLTFKADFDVLGTKNSLQKVDLVEADEVYYWSNGEKRNTMKIEKSFIASEDDAKIDFGYNGGTQYSIVNKDAPNKFGEYPGYRIVPHNVNSLTFKNSPVGGNGIRQVNHHFYVTQQKDEEQRASHPYNIHDIVDPVVNFDKYFDGESLEQEDIVLWFNLGMHHIPHTGDLPNTVFSTAHSAMTIQPLNYLLSDPSRASLQQVRTLADSDTPITFGAKAVNCSVSPAQINVDPGRSGYVQDYKKPYEP